jgi:class 3 adenylate cyclase
VAERLTGDAGPRRRKISTVVGPTSSPGDARNRWTLTFDDPELERDYQQTATMRRAELRLSFLGSAVLWLVGGLIVPLVIPAPAAIVYALAGFEVVGNVVAFAAFPRLRTRTDQGRVSLVLNLLSALVAISLVGLVDRFDDYAAPTLMIISVVALVALRLRFTHSVIAAIGYIALFIAFAIPFARSPILLQGFLVFAAAIVGAMGTFVLEDADRRIFAQGRTIARLHAQVDELFHQYLSPTVADTLLQAPERAALGGEIVEVSVLFADLQGFTTFSERSDPNAVVRLVNEYFEAAVPLILDEGGTITQFAGDALMAIFNAPIHHADHARRAARAALAMQAACEAISVQAGDARPRFRVGIATGPALVGNIGSRDVRNFTAIGDTPNLASRLQTFAEPGSVVIDGRTRDLIGAARTPPLGAPALKGRTVPVEVFELLALEEGQPVVAGAQPPGRR